MPGTDESPIQCDVVESEFLDFADIATQLLPREPELTQGHHDAVADAHPGDRILVVHRNSAEHVGPFRARRDPLLHPFGPGAGAACDDKHAAPAVDRWRIEKWKE